MRCLQVMILSAVMLVLLPRSAAPIPTQSVTEGFVHIFFSAGCADCWPYVEKTLVPTLRIAGITAEPVVQDFTRPGGRQLLADQAASVGLPRRIADSMYAFVGRPDGGVLVILGHVPGSLLAETLSRDQLPRKLVIQQPKMHGSPEEYRLWPFAGEVLSFPISTPLDEALLRLPSTAGHPLLTGDAGPEALLPAVVVAGLLDSVNPCAMAVILLFLAFLFTIRKSRRQILGLGAIYVAVIFVVYFAIGLGILSAVRLSDTPHFVARLGSYLLIGLGTVNLIEYCWPQFPVKLHMPAAAHKKVNQLLRLATVPTTIAVGFIVGLCTFPCSGGIYVSIIMLLNAKTTLAWGLGYLTLYNILYILPLVIILLAVGNRVTAKKLAAWERENALRLRLVFGLIMIGLGVLMLGVVIPSDGRQTIPGGI